jgi:NADPH-dependent curcumin reductase CurA
MPPELNRQIVLRSRPDGLASADNFEAIDAPMPELADGDALVRNDYLSIDPTIRTWVSDAKSYFPPVELGEAVRCSGAGVVVESKCDTLPVGQVVYSLTGWQEYAVVHDDPFVTKLDPGTNLRHVLGVLGGNGMAAYFGLLEIGRPSPGETVVVSGAAGATGSIAGQIARIKGCRVVGFAGSDEKCEWVTGELGFDACLNYRTEDLPARLREVCPDRIDVYFDNVGGEILDIVLRRLNMGARIVLCGAISVYNDEHKPPGPANYLNLITSRGRMEGFNAFDYWDRFDDVIGELSGWMESGELHFREHLVDGLDRAPEALNMLFTGENLGKVIVAISEEARAEVARA